MKEDKIKELNIFQKMSAITTEMAVVEKNLKVEVSTTNSYKAVSERDVLDNVKPLEAKYHIYSYPYERQIIDKDTLIKEKEYKGNLTRTPSLFMRLETMYRFVNMDNPQEFIDIKTYGDGIDTGDKATGKAMTYADKYALMKAYKISTGDDPDKDASPSEGYQKEDNSLLASEVQTMAIKTDTDIEKILETYKVKSFTEMSVKDLNKLLEILKQRELKKNSMLEEAEKELENK